ncbi:iron ABC transporter ATP-binding protein [Agromyces sp. Marseille-P2726]|uniref:iron ABC transporter ATP-binding protein n=1 Tax=Agromyces sp. Marseille-P2726 TaxID=2709132 RepID=UPI00156E9B01|nr:iron ABC transporter ATP-binding protein [Agromyces sp. Marseille-P2726]
MPRLLRPSLARSAGLALVAAASVAMLSGCTPGAAAPSETAAPPNASASPTPGATAAPTEEPEEPTPFSIGCDELLTPDQLYEFNPNFGTHPDYEPASAEVITIVEEDAGTACGYLNQTSGEVIEVGVATPSPKAGETRRNEAAMTSHVVPTYGTPPDIEGYFTQAGGGGVAQVFHGPYWIVIESAALFEPGDAAQLVAAVIGNLPEA